MDSISDICYIAGLQPLAESFYWRVLRVAPKNKGAHAINRYVLS